MLEGEIWVTAWGYLEFSLVLSYAHCQMRVFKGGSDNQAEGGWRMKSITFATKRSACEKLNILQRQAAHISGAKTDSWVLLWAI